MEARRTTSLKLSLSLPFIALAAAIAGVLLIVQSNRLSENMIQNDMRLLMVKAETREFVERARQYVDGLDRSDDGIAREGVLIQAKEVRKLLNAALSGGETPIGILRPIEDEHIRGDIKMMDSLLSGIDRASDGDEMGKGQINLDAAILVRIIGIAVDISRDIGVILEEDRKLLSIIQAGIIAIILAFFLAVIYVLYRNHVLLKEENFQLSDEAKKRTEDLEAALTRIKEQMSEVEKANSRLVLINSSVSRLQDVGALQVMADHNEVIFRRVVRDAMSLTEAQYGALSIFDDSGNMLRFIAEGLSEGEAERIGSLPTGKGLLGLFFKQKDPLRIKDVSLNNRSCGFPEHHPEMRTFIGVPITAGGRSRGALYLTEKAGGSEFTEDDEAVLGLYASDIGHAIERSDFISELDASNKKLIAKQSEQAMLINKLKDAQTQLLQSEKMASIGQLAAGIAHEINNPIGYVNSNMTSLQRYLNDIFLLLDTYGDLEANLPADDVVHKAIATCKKNIDFEYVRTDVTDLLRECHEGIDRVQRIVQDLKDFSHSVGTEWQWANIHKGIDSTLNIVHNEIKYKADVVKEYGDLPDIECMPHQLNQVFMNLLVNAAHAIEERGTILIRTGVEGDRVWIDVIDNGKGIKGEDLNHIFDPFFTTKPVGKGTGLGLSISYNVVKKHGGDIEVESEPGKGARFRIWLPMRRDVDRENALSGQQPVKSVADTG